jgi:aspartate aminotransferase-like enzyme
LIFTRAGGISRKFPGRVPCPIAWEAALVNTLSPQDRVLMYETGHFASLWQKLAARHSGGSDRGRVEAV